MVVIEPQLQIVGVTLVGLAVGGRPELPPITGLERDRLVDADHTLAVVRARPAKPKPLEAVVPGRTCARTISSV